MWKLNGHECYIHIPLRGVNCQCFCSDFIEKLLFCNLWSNFAEITCFEQKKVLKPCKVCGAKRKAGLAQAGNNRTIYKWVERVMNAMFSAAATPRNNVLVWVLCIHNIRIPPCHANGVFYARTWAHTWRKLPRELHCVPHTDHHKRLKYQEKASQTLVWFTLVYVR